MLAILTTHPIQYQVPIWQALAKAGRVPFEVWYLTDHGTHPSLDMQFGKTFSWDIDMLSGYPYHFLKTGEGASPTTPWKCRLHESLRVRIVQSGVKALWIQGWQVAAYWQSVREAKLAGAEVWLRAESNDLSSAPLWKRPLKQIALGGLFKRIDRFLYIGSANKRLYQHHRVPNGRLYSAPYAVDNDRFTLQARALRQQRMDLRHQRGISDEAFCVLFCGKFIRKKRPLDLVAAVKSLRAKGERKLHLLFVGSGELDYELRKACHVMYDAEASDTASAAVIQSSAEVPASFLGFLNQTEISRAYVAADCPSIAKRSWRNMGISSERGPCDGTAVPGERRLRLRGRFSG